MKRAFKNLKATVEDSFSLQFPGASQQYQVFYPPPQQRQSHYYCPPPFASTMATPMSMDNPRIFPERQEDMMLYRKHRGVNLGSWFVLERWITESPYREAAGPGQSDLDIARGRNAKSILEKHWDTWVVEKDWNWIASVGINAVRIPIGYYHVCGADRSILDGTDFYPFFDVYEGSWRRITNAIAEAHKRNISVMLDLHAAPGKQNADAHSGTSNSPNFFNDPHNQRRGLYALTSLTRALTTFLSSPAHPVPLNNVIGIQLINEPAPPNDKILQDFYTSTILELQKIAPGIPIYLGEVWRSDTYADYVARELAPRLASNENAMIVLDHHLYRCFTPSDNNTPVAQHTRAIRNGETPDMLARVSEKMGRLGGGLVVAEWSGGLHPNSLTSLRQSQHLQARKEFVQAQLETYERTCGGWYFWCYKKEYAGDVGWSFKEAFEKGVFDKRFGVARKKRWWEGDFEKEGARRMAALGVARDAMYKRHVQYWAQFPNQTYQHERFLTGFDVGWYANWRYLDSLNPEDAKVSEIGFKHALAWRSSQNHTGNYWEYEQGFLQGCDSAKADFVKAFG